MDDLPPPDATLPRPLADFAGWHLTIACPTCRLLVQLRCTDLAGVFPGLTVGDAVGRLRCSRCGGKPASVTLADGAEGDGRAALNRVRLV